MKNKLFVTLIFISSLFCLTVLSHGKTEKDHFSALLAPLLEKDFSFMNESLRQEVHSLLAEINRNHVSQLGKRILSEDIDIDTIDKESINYLSLKLPKAEKVVIYALKRQYQALDQYISEKMETPASTGKMRRVQKKQDRVFEHYGNRYYTELISIIHDISVSQRKIDSSCKQTAPVDRALKIEEKDVAEYVLNQLHIITSNSKKLNDHNN